ncbi:MAG: AAA family ATPase [Thermomicrobiales bacterium]
MRIEGIQIAEFGQFQEASFGPFSRRVTVIHGPNEAGKSTIHAFIRAMLFGFEVTATQGAMPVSSSGCYGGRLILRDDSDARYIVERFLDIQAGTASLRHPDGTRPESVTLPEILGYVSPELFQSVFAFGIDELQSIASLPDEAMSSRMYWTGLGLEHLPDSMARFRQRAGQLFTPGGRIEPVPRLLDELARIDQELAVSRVDAERYYQLLHQRREVDLDVRNCQMQLSSINQIDQRLGEGAWQLARERDRLSGASSRLEEFDRAFPGREVSEQPESAESADAQLRRQIDELRESWTRLQATRRMTEVYQATIVRQRIPRNASFIALMVFGVLIPVIVGVVIGQLVVISIGIASAALGMIAFVLATIARSRFETAQIQAQLHLEMTHREVEGRFLYTAMALSIDPEHVDEEIERLEQSRTGVRISDEPEMTMQEREILRQERILAVAEASEAVERRVETLEKAREAWTELAGDLGLPDEFTAEPSLAARALEKKRTALLIERGRLDEQLSRLESDNTAAALRMQREEMLSKLREHVREWASNIVAGRLLGETVDAYEESRKPEVLKAASDVFDSMTLGAYHQLIAAGDGNDVAAISRNGQTVSIAEMSRGTREQAYLSLRIGLIRTIGSRGRSLPVLVDDILVNFDPDRAAEAMRALDGLSAEHQVILFTCHPSTVALARFVMPGSRIVTLGDQKIGGFAPIRVDND